MTSISTSTLIIVCCPLLTLPTPPLVSIASSFDSTKVSSTSGNDETEHGRGVV